MTEETARQTAGYIQKHCSGRNVNLRWFGGEPLYHKSPIRTICKALRDHGVNDTSQAISNACLFDRETIAQAVSLWNLTSVQVTLDGTRETYNRVKVFIYKDSDPYSHVLNHIEALSDAGIRVIIRLNLGLYNADEMSALVSELAERFYGRTNLKMYTRLLFETAGNAPLNYDVGKRTALYQKQQAIERQIFKYGFQPDIPLKRSICTTHCMADKGSAVVITPSGHIGLCEHYSGEYLIGHIAEEKTDFEMAEVWQQRREELPECASCVCFPECVPLKKCPEWKFCYPRTRMSKQHRLEQSMLYEYRRFLKKAGKNMDPAARTGKEWEYEAEI